MWRFEINDTDVQLEAGAIDPTDEFGVEKTLEAPSQAGSVAPTFVQFPFFL